MRTKLKKITNYKLGLNDEIKNKSRFLKRSNNKN
jgi:hypothetical protein